jgi:hypothetical protein
MLGREEARGNASELTFIRARCKAVCKVIREVGMKSKCFPFASHRPPRHFRCYLPLRHVSPRSYILLYAILLTQTPQNASLRDESRANDLIGHSSINHSVIDHSQYRGSKISPQGCPTRNNESFQETFS